MPTRDDAVLAFLARRRSVPLTMMTGPGPSETELDAMLELAARVPDHGRLEPWRFIVYRDGEGAQIGEKLEALSRRIRPDLAESEYERDAGRLRRAPIAIGVVFTPKEHDTIPQWEQFLSAGAVATTLVQAATAMGFGANWVTGWFSDEPEGRRILGLAPDERIAGIVHIGNCDREIAERPRPDVKSLTRVWTGPYETGED